MTSLESLENPLERLQLLPNVMNWRGVWGPTTQYYRNDVVISPVDTASYIALTTAIVGGGDPSTNPTDWVVLSPATGGVIGVQAGAGISITGTPTLPQINNTGILTLTAGTGITNTNTATDPILQNTGLLVLNAGTGIAVSVGQTPTITNSGVLSIAGGTGISVTGSPNAPTLANTGVLQVTGGAGINVSAGQTPTITNSGVQTITGGTGVVISGPPQTPTISVTAVGTDPLASSLLGSLITMGPPPATTFIPPTNTGFGTLVFGPNSLSNMILNGSPDPNGTWILDFSSYAFYADPPAGGTNTIVLGIEDITTVGGPYTYTGVAGTGTLTTNAQPPMFFNLGKFYLDVAACRATGFRSLDQILVSNDTGGDLYNVSYGAIIATYYPNGIQ